MKDTFLAKWINDELSEQELLSFKESKEFGSFNKIISTLDRLEAPAFDEAASFATFKANHLANTPSKVAEPKVIKFTSWKTITSIAAAIVFMVGFYSYYTSLDTSYNAELAQQIEVVLPDNSEVMVNAGSEISFNKRNWDDTREVTLDGEAFFKVEKGQKFDVLTSDGVVSVLGTHFNVNNRKDFYQVTCFEGLVSVAYNGTTTKLPAGTSFTVLNGEVVNAEAPGTLAPSWTTGYQSTFKSMPLSIVIAELERQHDIVIETSNIDLTKSFTGSFNNKEVNLAIRSISIPLNLIFEIEDKKVKLYANNKK